MPRVRETVSERAIQRVADVANVDALDLPPLWDAIDPDALDALISDMSDGEISFIYAGHEITVTSDETITVNDLPTDGALSELPECDD